MKSLKVKLVSIVSAFILALSLLIVGVWAVGQSQTITMEGSVNFDVADKSLYVKDVRMQEDNNSTPYSLKEKEQDKFMPGYINGNFNMNLGEFTNDYGTFALYFDIINTMDESTGETFAYTVDPPTQPSNGTATITILDNNGDTIDRIPQGTVKPSQITTSTQASASIKLIVSSPSASQVDLSEITITINQFIPPEVYDYFTFDINEDNQTVTLTAYNSSLSDSTDVVIPTTVSQNAEGQWIEGDTYTVTAIADGGDDGNGVFTNSGITSIELPSTLESIGDFAFLNCSSLTGELNLEKCTSLTSIGEGAFNSCSSLTSITLPEGLISIGNLAFSSCRGLTGTVTIPASVNEIGANPFMDCILEGITVESGNSSYYDEGNCLIEKSTKTLITGFNNFTIPSDIKVIGNSAFFDCGSLTSITLPSSLTSIGDYAFWWCDGFNEVIIDSEYVYTNAKSASACGWLFANSSITTVKVLTSLDDGTNSYITTNFPNVSTEVIEGKSYTVYSKN